MRLTAEKQKSYVSFMVDWDSRTRLLLHVA